MNFIIDNKEWIFSGIGISIFGLAGSFLIFVFKKFILKNNKSDNSKQNIKSGKNSTNIQVGGDIHINEKNNEKKGENDG